MGASAILPRLKGQGQASELLYTGRSMTGEEGAAWGFFNRLAASEQVLAEATATAGQIASRADLRKRDHQDNAAPGVGDVDGPGH